MEKLLLYMGLALVLLLSVATVVAVFEQLRDRARLSQWRAEASDRRAFEWNLAAQERATRNLADGIREPTPAPSGLVEPRTTVPGVTRRSARPAVGHPSSGWTETEPMVLGGPSRAHFDPTEITRPRVTLHAATPVAASRSVAEPSAAADL
ncbi:MAG: hypothetical protein M3Y32_08990 [Pseudomonadota bacterium]|nr:hypothetical protein [Pseudomonadota bacterium]